MFLCGSPSSPSRDSSHTYAAAPNEPPGLFVHLFHILPHEAPLPVYLQVHRSILSSPAPICCLAPWFSLYTTVLGNLMMLALFYKSYLFTGVLHLMSHHCRPFLLLFKYGDSALLELVSSSCFGVLAYAIVQHFSPSEIISIDCSLFLLKCYTPCFSACLIIFCPKNCFILHKVGTLDSDSSP